LDFKFNKSVRIFNIDAFDVIGNFENGNIVGLTPSGLNLVSKIDRGEDVNLDSLSSDMLTLLETLKDGEYFSSNNDGTKLFSAYVHVTHNCNLHCIGCYSWVDYRNNKSNLTTGQMYYIINELKSCGVESIVFSGGEPFLRDDFHKICKYAKEVAKIPKVSVITNGTVQHERYDKCLNYLDYISVSLDGYDEKTQFIRDPGIMPKVFDTISYLKTKDIKVSFITTLHSKNVDYMDKYVQLSKSLDLEFNFSPLTVDVKNLVFQDYILGDDDMSKVGLYVASGGENVSVLDSALHGSSLYCTKGCGVGRNIISIGADGTVYPCHMLHVENCKLGNILDTRLGAILSSEENPFQNLSVECIEPCNKCEFKYLCGGACRAGSYYKYGNIYSQDEKCNMTKAFLRNIIQQLKDEVMARGA
jgi:radical SAM protein with 4Fe4S-binding SPASM domain